MSLLLIILGGALGVANQSAADTDLALRLPALLAAMLMVGHGFLELQRKLKESKRRSDERERLKTQKAVEEDAAARRQELQAAEEDAQERTPATVVAQASGHANGSSTAPVDPRTARHGSTAPAPVPAKPDPDADEPVPAPPTIGVPVGLMGLGIWLGLADLVVPTPSAALRSLSIVASFLIFALGWSVLPAKR